MTDGVVCVVGSLNADRYLGLAQLPEPGETVFGDALGLYPGGKGLNQAVAAARSGANVRMCGALGADAEAQFLRAAMTQVGVDGSAVAAVEDANTGIAYILSQAGGENSIIVVQGANALIDPAAVVAAVKGAAVVLVQLEIDLGVVARSLSEARRCGALTVMNAAPAHFAVWSMLPDVDILIVNEGEASALGGIKALSEHTTVVHTRGAAGLSVYPRNGGAFEMQAFEVATVDTTGAGDAFCGGFVAALATGSSLAGAARTGAAAGAIVAAHRGAQTPALTSESLAAMIHKAPRASSEN